MIDYKDVLRRLLEKLTREIGYATILRYLKDCTSSEEYETLSNYIH